MCDVLLEDFNVVPVNESIGTSFKAILEKLKKRIDAIIKAFLSLLDTFADIRFSELCDKADVRVKEAGDDAYNKALNNKIKVKPFLNNAEIDDIIKSVSGKRSCFDYGFHVIKSLNKCLSLAHSDESGRITDGDKEILNKLSSLETSKEIEISVEEALSHMSDAGFDGALRDFVKHAEIREVKDELKTCNKLISSIGKSDDKTKSENELLLSVLNAMTPVLSLMLNTYTNVIRVVKYFATCKFES